MRMLDNETDQGLKDVLILLTRREAEWLRSAVTELLADAKQEHHHIMDMEDYSRELTVALYDEADAGINTYTARVADLIRNGK